MTTVRFLASVLVFTPLCHVYALEEGGNHPGLENGAVYKPAQLEKPAKKKNRSKQASTLSYRNYFVGGVSAKGKAVSDTPSGEKSEGLEQQSDLFSIELLAGNDDQRLANLNVSKSQESGDFALQLSGYSQDAYALPDGFSPKAYEDADSKSNSDAESNTVYAHYNWRLSGKTQLGLAVEHSKEERGIPFKDGVVSSVLPPQFERVDTEEQTALQLNLQHRINTKQQLVGSVYYRHRDRLMTGYADPELTQQVREDDAFSHNGGASLKWISRFSRHRFVAEVAAENQLYQLKRDVVAPPLPPPQGQAQRSSAGEQGAGPSQGGDPSSLPVQGLDGSQHQILYNLMLSYHWQPERKYGARISGAVLYGDLEQRVHPSILAEVFYQLNDVVKITASSARTVRYPSLNEIYENTQGRQNQTVSSKGLFEEGDQAASFRGNRENSVELTLFENSIKRYSDKLTEGFYEESERQHHYGLDLSWTNRSFDFVSLSAGYQLAKVDNPALEDLERPEHTLRASLSFSLPWQLQIQLDGQHGVYDDDSPAIFDDYTQVDLVVRQPLPLKGVSWGVKVTNVTDELYYLKQDQIASGRQWLVGIAATF